MTLQEIFDLLCEKLAEEKHIRVDTGNSMFISSSGSAGTWRHLNLHYVNDDGEDYTVVVEATKTVEELLSVENAS